MFYASLLWDLNHQMRQPNTAVFSLFIINIAYMRILVRLFVSFGTPIFLPFLMNVPFNWPEQFLMIS